MIAVETVVVRIALALAFGAVIGVEREWRQKHAGLKTMTLVVLGAAAFAMMSDTFGPENHNPGQIAAAVVGGIGFIGAGVIMHRGLTVQGVTTAATLWAGASVGVAVGLGQYTLSAVLTTGIVFVQFIFRGIEMLMTRFARRDAPGRFELRVDCDEDTLHAANEEWMKFASDPRVTLLRRSVFRGVHAVTLRAVLRANEPVDVSELEERLIALHGVRRVDVRHLGMEED
ncbi:MAG TPA: MgtC/SapB family protein [Thermoanaerobaculia bacterium]|nr:MgtC/SapB family protein [Thermoanaerobaculia bacterium]